MYFWHDYYNTVNTESPRIFLYRGRIIDEFAATSTISIKNKT